MLERCRPWTVQLFDRPAERIDAGKLVADGRRKRIRALRIALSELRHVGVHEMLPFWPEEVRF
jgi:hypothetical protein